MKITFRLLIAGIVLVVSIQLLICAICDLAVLQAEEHSQNSSEGLPMQFQIWAKQGVPYPEVPAGWNLLSERKKQLPAYLIKKYKDIGYIIFSKPYSKLIYPDTMPDSSEIVDTISAFASLNEYEPLTFSVYALRDIDDIKVYIDDLKSENGQVLFKRNFDLRMVGHVRKIIDKKDKKYTLFPFTLEKPNCFIKKNTTKQYWITLKVPEGIQPGVYTGQLHFQPSNGKETNIAVNVRIFPFQLENSPVVRFMWSLPRLKFSNNKIKMFLDMREHGMTTAMIRGQIKSRDRIIQMEDIDHIVSNINEGIKLHGKAGFRDAPIGGVNNNQIIYYWDKSLHWFRFWPVSEELSDQFLNVYRKVFIEYGRNHNWPDMLHYVVDEPGGTFPKNLEPSAFYLKLLKDKFPSLKTFVTIGGGTRQGYDEIGMLGQYLDITCSNYFTKKIIEGAHENNSDLWLYNYGSLGDMEPVRDRFFFGFYVYKTRSRGIGQWVYTQGKPFEVPFRGDFGYCYETEEGFLPTIHWEMIREGIDDLNYAYTLQSLINRAFLSKNEKAKNLAVKEMNNLKKIMSQINLLFERGKKISKSGQINLSHERLGQFRLEIANGIKVIQEALEPFQQ